MSVCVCGHPRTDHVAALIEWCRNCTCVEFVERPLSDYPTIDHPDGHIGPPDGLTIEQAFRRFHAANPQVYRELVLLARRGKRAGARKLGIGQLFEVLRWRYILRTGGDEFKLNNNYRSYYARMIMSEEPDLDGIFETRRLHAPV